MIRLLKRWLNRDLIARRTRQWKATIGGDPSAMEITNRVPLRVRFWRILGFKYHMGLDPEEIWKNEEFTGFGYTNIRLHFSFSDRLRLLLTGRLHIGLQQYETLGRPVKHFHNRISWCIIAPRGDWPA